MFYVILGRGNMIECLPNGPLAAFAANSFSAFCSSFCFWRRALSSWMCEKERSTK